MKLSRILPFILAAIVFGAGAQSLPSPTVGRITISGTGSTGDVSATSVTATGSTAARTLANTVPAVGNQTPVAGSKMRIDNLLESNVLLLQNEAGIWPGTTYSYFGISKSFDGTNSAGSTGSPVTPLFAYAVSNGSVGDVVGVMADCVVNQNNGICFGANPIARTSASITGAKLVGMELDVEPASSATVSSGTGLIINAFNLAMPGGYAVQIGGLNGGTFANGIGYTAIAGSANFATTGASMQSFINTVNGTFTDAAIALGQGQLMRFRGGGSFTDAYITNNTTGFLELHGSQGGGITFRNGANTTNLLYIDDNTGNLNLQVSTAAMVGTTGNLNIRGGGTVGGGTITAQSPLVLTSFTVATLPTCNTAERDAIAVVIDATSPTYRATLVGGGSVRTQAYCDGSNWTAH